MLGMSVTFFCTCLFSITPARLAWHHGPSWAHVLSPRHTGSVTTPSNHTDSGCAAHFKFFAKMRQCPPKLVAGERPKGDLWRPSVAWRYHPINLTFSLCAA